MKNLGLGLLAFLALSGSLLPSLSFATASLQGSTITLPYVTVGDVAYSAVLELVANNDSVDFTIVSTAALADSGVRAGTSTFSDNVLSISVLRSGHISYQVQLNYIAEEAVFRLEEPVVTLTDTTTDASFLATDWLETTHSNDVDPNFSEVFDDTMVKRLDFVVTAQRWQSMLDDMTATYGEFGSGTVAGPGAGGPGPGGPPGAGGPGGGGGGLLEVEADPIFVPADVFYDGVQWYRVGIRFKGNSTLQGSWNSGILKLSFKLDFDEFEDEYPQIKNQRFHGFKKFSLKNNYNDESQLREKVAADVFANAGVPVSHTGFYTLYVDHGNGPEYFGLYTLVEEVDGPVLDTQFVNDDGNLYKPEDSGADFVAGTFSEESFVKKTNEDDEDWSDILAMFAALHDDSVSDDVWRENLESVFNVDGFIKYLAVNGVIQNWDSYGRMAHNYYLYNDPETMQLTWIPWDHNEVLQAGNQGGAAELDFSNIDSASWPLISKIYADDVYRAQYNLELSAFINGAFDTATMQNLYDTYSQLVEPYAITERAGYSFLNGANDFSNAVEELKAHASERATAVSEYLSAQ